MRRRDLIKSLVSASALTAIRPAPGSAEVLKACVPETPPQSFAASLEDTPIIDVHCHIFNVTDIPAYQFAESVVGLTEAFDKIKVELGKTSIYQMEKWEKHKIYRKRDEWWAKVYTLVQKYGVFVTKSRPLDRLALTPGFVQERTLQQGCANRKEINLAIIEDEMFSMLVGKVSSGDNAHYMQDWIKVVGGEWSQSQPGPAVARCTRWLKKLNRRLESANPTLNSGLRFLMSMSQSRLENFLRLREAYKIRGQRASKSFMFYTPALIDLDYWLDGPTAPQPSGRTIKSLIDIRPQPRNPLLNPLAPREDPPPALKRNRTTLSQQSELMESLARLFPGEVHSYFPICPWRQVDAKFRPNEVENPLKLLEEALDARGFIGVKLYPPMGFRPINNAKIEDHKHVENQMFPEHLYERGRFPYVPKASGLSQRAWNFEMSRKFGELLDQALMDLYRYCARRNVPILTHAAPTNFSGGYDYFDKQDQKVKHSFFSEKGSPGYWKTVVGIPGLNELRLNLGHAGFDMGGWMDMIITAMDSGPNVFADISYFDEFLGSERGDACGPAKDKALRFKAPIPDTDARWPRFKEYRWSRFMYGSDWFMCTKERHFDNYLDVVAKTWFAEVAKNETEPGLRLKQVLSANAARFLGFGLTSGNADSNYTRLMAFYEENADKVRGGRNAALAAQKKLDRLAKISELSTA